MPPDAPLILVALAAGLALWLAWRQRQRTRRLEARLDAFLTGREGKSLEHLLVTHGAALGKLEGKVHELRQASEYLHRALQSAVRKVAFERYNPFPGLGGNQSFSLALLDAHNGGVVITSLHNREGTRVYAKAVREGRAVQQLSAEEERVLQRALAQKGA